MLNNTQPRNIFHSINIECIRLKQTAVHDILRPIEWTFDALHLCGILSHFLSRALIRFLAMFAHLYIRCFSISQTFSTGDMKGDNLKQEWHSTRKYSCRCLAVKHWSINALLAFNQVTPIGIWLNTQSGKEQNHKKKYNKVFFSSFFPIKTGRMICLNVLVWYLPTNAYSASGWNYSSQDMVPEVGHTHMHILPLCGAT